MDDFTPEEAQAWIAQELASCRKRRDDPKETADRYEAEGKMFTEAGLDKSYPVSTAARAELIKQLRAL